MIFAKNPIIFLPFAIMNEVEILHQQPRIIPQSCCDTRSTQLSTFHPCNPRTLHKHGRWTYDCSAWETVQEKGHVGTGGRCVGGKSTTHWDDVLSFYREHRTAAYCSITAQRMIWTSETNAQVGSTQYVTLYLKCVGCECTNDRVEDWVALGRPTDLCTDARCKPVFDRDQKREEHHEVSKNQSSESITASNRRRDCKPFKDVGEKFDDGKETCVVIYNSDDGLSVMSVPKSVLATDVGKEVIGAITGHDERFHPYTSMDPDTEFIGKIHGTLAEWKAKYGMDMVFNAEHVVCGSEYI